MPRQARVKCWCFTLNNYTEDEFLTLQRTLELQKPTFAIIAKEVGDNQTPHLQGYVHLTKRTVFSDVKKILGIRAHIEQARGSDQDSLLYCSKQDPNPFIIGAPDLKSGGSAKRIALHRAASEWIAGVTGGESIFHQFTKSPDSGMAYLRHFKAIENIVKDKRRIHSMDKIREEYTNATLRIYQARIDRMVKLPPDPRTIHWFYDERGNTGKSWMTNWLMLNHGAICFSNGKSADIAYAYSGERIVVFDFTRSMQDVLNYQVIEELKNGRIFSPKYESCCKLFPRPHVICFANWLPDYGKMSADRWDIHEILDEDCEQETDQDQVELENFIFEK
ncbi:replication-associated protein [Tentweb spider associated circular virus 1]|uniref:Replication-associated protein n=1 Tax=Tentweb spider associated circular virus 1 TaxID=2293307 RepID=A0A346BPD0_9VIRU|nr:replication-associated protein [Tentweb spider associated circular virus 1]AXL65927.1 replication-associated protein [Tentweb spider associated circular virus 1]